MHWKLIFFAHFCSQDMFSHCVFVCLLVCLLETLLQTCVPAFLSEVHRNGLPHWRYLYWINARLWKLQMEKEWKQPATIFILEVMVVTISFSLVLIYLIKYKFKWNDTSSQKQREKNELKTKCERELIDRWRRTHSNIKSTNTKWLYLFM